MAPLKKVTQRLMVKPWITRDILDKCKNCNTLLDSTRKENDHMKKSQLMKEYKVLRNRITGEKR